MTGLTVLLFGLAGALLVAAVCAIYAHEYPGWRAWWRPDGDAGVQSSLRTMATLSDAPDDQPEAPETATVNVMADQSDPGRRRTYPRDVFKYTIRRPTAAVRKKMPDLGGFSEVPLRLYDQLGNRFTVHQKVRLN